MTQKKYWWIDDNRTRVEDVVAFYAKRRGNGKLSREVHLDLVHIPDGTWEKVDERIQQVNDASYPDLILIDQILQNHGQSLSFKGSSLAMAVRTELPHAPIVLVSAGDMPLSRQIGQGVDFFKVTEVQSGERYDDLWAIAEGFSRVRKSNLTGDESDRLAALTKLIGVPEEDRGLFKSTIPGEYLRTWDKETIHSFTRWMWKVFLDRPGYVMNDWHLATMLGVTPEGLETIKVLLEPCLYQQIFASAGRPRWWFSLVRPALEKKDKLFIHKPLAEIGRSLVKKRFWSSPFGRDTTSTEVPDCVAWRDERRKSLVQALQGDTRDIPYDTPGFGYVPQRVFTGVQANAKAR